MDHCEVPRATHFSRINTVLHSTQDVTQCLIPRLHDRANIEQAWWNPAPGSNVGLWPTADHVLYRPSNYNPPALLINMLVTIAGRASSMFARSRKRGISLTANGTRRDNMPPRSSSLPQSKLFILHHPSSYQQKQSGFVVADIIRRTLQFRLLLLARGT